MDLISFPVLIRKGGKWFETSCSMLDIPTQGRSGEEVKKYRANSIEEYMEIRIQKNLTERQITTSVTLISIPVMISGVYRSIEALHEVNNMENVYKLGEGD